MDLGGLAFKVLLLLEIRRLIPIRAMSEGFDSKVEWNGEKRLVSIREEDIMELEVVTFTPIDLDAIDVSEMNREERNYLNSYHKLVYDKISTYLNDDEREWLKEYTREV